MNTNENLTSPELIFIPKSDEPCEECKDKAEITLELPLYTYQEYLKVEELTGKYKLSQDELNYIYNFYNRVFQTNKTPGCGKCLANMLKRLKHKFKDYS